MLMGMRGNNEFLLKLKEAAISIVPVFLLIIILNFSLSAISLDDPSFNNVGPVFVSFCISIVPLVVGLALFSMGADKAMGKIGEIAGTTLTKRKSLFLLLIIGFLMGVLLTLAEPDLSVLSSRFFPGNERWILMIITAIGVGVFLVVAMLRVIFQKSLKTWLIIGYGLVFALGCVTNDSFYSIVFDSGGATTGAVSVPFVLALGIGVASIRGGKNAEDDSFGYSGLCSLGPLVSVMIMSAFLSNGSALESIENGLVDSAIGLTASIPTYRDISTFYLDNFVSSLSEVALSMSPIVVFFFVYQFFLKLKKRELVSIFVGLLYTFIGLVLFLMGASSGFIPVATSIGEGAVSLNFPLFLFIGFAIGCLIILAEPGVHVLADQVSEVSRGALGKKSIYIALCLATGLAVVFNAIRIRYNIPIAYFVIPIYILAFALSFFVSEIYVGVAFDSSGIATGTLSSCFLLPMFIGYSLGVYNDPSFNYQTINEGQFILENGFGVLGMVSVMPLVAIESLGLFGILKSKKAYRRALLQQLEKDDNQVIHLPSWKKEESNG